MARFQKSQILGIIRSHDPWCPEIGGNGHDVATGLTRLRMSRNTTTNTKYTETL